MQADSCPRIKLHPQKLLLREVHDVHQDKVLQTRIIKQWVKFNSSIRSSGCFHPSKWYTKESITKSSAILYHYSYRLLNLYKVTSYKEHSILCTLAQNLTQPLHLNDCRYPFRWNSSQEFSIQASQLCFHVLTMRRDPY